MGEEDMQVISQYIIYLPTTSPGRLEIYEEQIRAHPLHPAPVCLPIDVGVGTIVEFNLLIFSAI